jgi:hypothetical protein
VERLSFLKDSKTKKVAAIQVLLGESVEVLWLRLRELISTINYSGISVALLAEIVKHGQIPNQPAL